MLTLPQLGAQIASRRKALRINQSELAQKAGVSRVTLQGLETGRYSELGYSKVAKILSVLGLELKVQETGSRRPTLDELLNEERDDQGLDRRR
jgi:transcriptional regulator with XRE-family HTH domain